MVLEGLLRKNVWKFLFGGLVIILNCGFGRLFLTLEGVKEIESCLHSLNLRNIIKLSKTSYFKLLH